MLVPAVARAIVSLVAIGADVGHPFEARHEWNSIILAKDGSNTRPCVFPKAVPVTLAIFYHSLLLIHDTLCPAATIKPDPVAFLIASPSIIWQTPPSVIHVLKEFPFCSLATQQTPYTDSVARSMPKVIWETILYPSEYSYNYVCSRSVRLSLSYHVLLSIFAP